METIKAKTKNMHVEFLYLDLGSFKDVREFVEEVSRRTDTIDLLINSKISFEVTKKHTRTEANRGEDPNQRNIASLPYL